MGFIKISSKVDPTRINGENSWRDFGRGNFKSSPGVQLSNVLYISRFTDVTDNSRRMREEFLRGEIWVNGRGFSETRPDRPGNLLLTFMVSRIAHALSGFLYVLVLFATICVTAVSSFFLLSQAVRTSEAQTIYHNYNALVIGGSYGLVVSMACLYYCHSCYLTRVLIGVYYFMPLHPT